LANAPAGLQRPGERPIQIALDAHARIKDYSAWWKVRKISQVHQTIQSGTLPDDRWKTTRRASSGPFLQAALKPAKVSPSRAKLHLRYFFQANLARIIYRFPRYGELWNKWQADGKARPSPRDVGCKASATGRCSRSSLVRRGVLLAKDRDPAIRPPRDRLLLRDQGALWAASNSPKIMG